MLADVPYGTEWPSPAPVAPPRTLAEAAYLALREDILWGRLHPGAPLRSDTLRREYGLGISPLREALTRLVADRLVTAIGQRGFRVAPLLATEVAEVTRLRILIDGDALRHAIANGGPAWEAGVVATLHTLTRNRMPSEKGPEAQAWAAAHHAFHVALIDIAGAVWSLRLSELLYYQAERYRIVHARAVPRVTGRELSGRDVRAEHRDIAEAALARDADAAATSLGHHFQRTADLVLAHLGVAPAAASEPESTHRLHLRRAEASRD